MAESSSIPIAIIGIGCRLAGEVRDAEGLWKLLVEGRNTWSPVPPDRFNEEAFYHPHPDNCGTTNHRGGHFLGNNQSVAAFDAGFFGMSAAEAEATDPQQRLLLEVSYEAFENAGIPVEQMSGSDTAVYAAMFTRDYDRNLYKDTLDIPKYHTVGCGDAIMANRVSYVFNLKGPSMTLDTGCSGSLVALHQACQSLRVRESNAALACGVNLILNPDQMIGMSNLRMLNDNGRSWPFDARGGGYGRGEGVTAVVLKRLDDAEAAGDNIRAVIRSTAVNHDGKTSGITFPSCQAQVALHQKALHLAGLDSREIQYVEAHGTGTAAGDLAELQGIAQAFGRSRAPSDPIIVGSIKSNIGHVESSSGLAGLIKTVLMVERGCILPNADFQEPKPSLRLEEWNIRIPQKLESWPTLRRASVNSFGYGGVNVHVIVERHPAQTARAYHGYQGLEGEVRINNGGISTGAGVEVPHPEADSQVHQPKSTQCTSTRLPHLEQSISGKSTVSGADNLSRSSSYSKLLLRNIAMRLFVITANSQNGVLQLMRNLSHWISARLEEDIDLDSLAYTFANRRSMLQYRYAFQASSKEELLLRLEDGVAPTKSSKGSRMLFVFTGQGAQWPGMGRGLNVRYPVFRKSLLLSDEILRDLGASWALISELERSDQDSRIHQSEIAQPSSTALQIALVDLLRSFGVIPTTVIGHSSGEIAAAYAAGAISHRTALKISFSRSLLSIVRKQKVLGNGAMLAVGLGETQIAPFLFKHQRGVVSLACVNSPESTTISGDESAIVDLQDSLNNLGVFNRRLKVDTAYHSHHMRQVADHYCHSLGTIETNPIENNTTFISSVSGAKKTIGFDSDYWVENLVSKVRFSEALSEYCRVESLNSRNSHLQHIILEIGPQGALASPVRQNMTEAAGSMVYRYASVLSRDQNAIQTMLSSTGQIFECGHVVDLRAVNCLYKWNSRVRVPSDLPTYPWDHSKTYWHESRLSKAYRTRRYSCHDLLGVTITSSPSLAPSWRYIVSLDDLPWLADHVVDGLITFPAAGYVCMAIEASKQLAEEAASKIEGFVLRDVSFTKALVIPQTPERIEMQICFRHLELGQTHWNEFRIYALSRTGAWYEHCNGRISAGMVFSPNSREYPRSEPDLLGLDLTRCQTLGANEVYTPLRTKGNDYGPSFARIGQLQIANLQALARVTIPDIQSTMHAGYLQPHVIHPTTLDAILHAAVPLYEHHHSFGSVMPIFIEELKLSLQISNEPGTELFAAVELSPYGGRFAFADICVVDGEPMANKQHLTVSKMQLFGVQEAEQDTSKPTERCDVVYQMQWIPEVTSKGEKCDRLDLRLQSGVDPKQDDSVQHSSSIREPSPHVGGKIGNGFGPSRHQIEIIVSHGCQELAAALTSVLRKDAYNVSITTWASRIEAPEATYVILDNSDHPLLSKPSPALFQDINRRVQSVSSIFWVSAEVASSASKDPQRALVTGFARSARAEREQLRFTVLDVLDNVKPDLPMISRAVAQLITRHADGDDEMEFAYLNRQILVPRLIPYPHLSKCMAQAGEPHLEEAYYLNSKDSLCFDVTSVQSSRESSYVSGSQVSESLNPEDVRIGVLAHSFYSPKGNRTDKRSIPPTSIIQEFAGTVQAIGSHFQKEIRVGDTVIGWNFQSPVYLNWQCVGMQNVGRVPDRWPLSVAAAMVAPLMAIYYSLVEIAKLRQGQSLLIHGPAGLYAQTAIAMAMKIGAQVLATVPSLTQREALTNRTGLPASSFLCFTGSRLEKEVLKSTGGRGADVVLTMLSDGLAPDLGGCIAVLGVFLQVREPGESIEIMPPKFRSPAITYISVDMSTIAQHQPQLLAHSLERGVSMLPHDFVPSTSLGCFDMSHIKDALGESQKPTAPERIILTADTRTKVKVSPANQKNVRSDMANLRSHATYVIAGALGDLGQLVSVLMARSGAQHVVLLSRRSLCADEVDNIQRDLRRFSCSIWVHFFQCDISDRNAVQRVAAKLGSLALPAVRGLVMSATVLRDRVLERMTAEDWEVPLQTKVCGTRNLDEVFASSSLDFFVLLSSLSGVVGTRGQANYAAGNTYQDAFVSCRKSQTAYIALDLGMVEHTTAYNDKVGQVRVQNLRRQGWIPINSEQLTAILSWTFSPDARQKGSGQFIVGIDGASVFRAESATPTSKSAMFTHVRGSYEPSGFTAIAPTLKFEKTLTTVENLEEAEKLVGEGIRKKISTLVSVGMNDIGEDKSLQEIGLDSLTAIEVKNFVRKQFDATLQASEILDESSLAALSSKTTSRSGLLRQKFRKPSEILESAGESKSESAWSMELTEELSDQSKTSELPLPSLNDTLELYLTSVKPFLNANDMTRTAHVVERFREGCGKLLQEKCKSRQAAEQDGWQCDLQSSGVYLRSRLPVHPFQTFYGVHLLTARAHSQVEKAALIAETVYAFKRRLEANELPPDFLNDECLCSQSLNWLFNACREPHKNVDKVKKHECNAYLVVLRRGHIFKIALEEESRPLTRAQLRRIFDGVMDISSQLLPSVASLTALERDAWSELRDIVRYMSPTNSDGLSTIEAAAFVICLDDASPCTPTERCNSLLLGDPGNRWSDKTLQFVVCANGVSGFICEHSMLDAASLRQLNTLITAAIVECTANSTSEDYVAASTYSSVLEEIKFDANNVLTESIERLHKHDIVRFDPAEFAHFQLPSINHKLLQKYRVPTKAGIQVVIQLASLLYYGVQYPSWETRTMMLFRGGRLDWMQSVSPAMFAFCENAFNVDISLGRRSTMLREAASVHTRLMTRIYRGRGFAAHLEALQEIARQEEASPEFFADPTWQMMRVTSPRKLKTDAMEGLTVQEAGFFMPDPDSVFVHYEIDDSSCRLFVQSTEGRTDKFCKALDKAAKQVLLLLEVS